MFKHEDLLVVNWGSAIIGSVYFSQPVLSTAAYCFSILGSIVYIYTTIKKSKDK